MKPADGVPRRLVLLPAAVLSIPLALVSCSSDNSPTDCVLYDVGAVEGLVLAAGEGVAVQVGARIWEGDGRSELVATTWSDESGWYRLTLAGGL